MRGTRGWLLLGAGVVVAALLLAVPLGGWQHVDRAYAEAEHLQPGDRHRAEQFDTRVEGAEVLAQRPGSSFDTEEGVAYLAVRVELENVTDRTWIPPDDHLVVTGAGDLGTPDSVVLARDPGASYPGLQPGLPDEVLYVWEVADTAVAPGDELRVQVVDTTESESRVGAGTVWLFPRVGAVVDLTVEAGAA